jgi:hypothetical protein
LCEEKSGEMGNLNLGCEKRFGEKEMVEGVDEVEVKSDVWKREDFGNLMWYLGELRIFNELLEGN